MKIYFQIQRWFVVIGDCEAGVWWKKLLCGGLFLPYKVLESYQMGGVPNQLQETIDDRKLQNEERK